MDRQEQDAGSLPEKVPDSYPKLIYERNPGTTTNKESVFLLVYVTAGPRSSFLNLISRTDSYCVRKTWKRGICDELVKPLIGIQRVEVPPGESLAGTSVASVAIHRATGG